MSDRGARTRILSIAVLAASLGACATDHRSDADVPHGILFAGSLPGTVDGGATSRPTAPGSTGATPTSTTTTTTTTTTTSTTTTSTTTAAAVSRTITLAFSGDTLVHSPLWEQARRNAGGFGFDFDPMLIGLRPLLDTVDLAVCHLETPIAPAGEALSTAPIYGVPAEIVGAIAAAGYDRCSTASNHAIDRGVAGIDRTVGELQARGLGQSGMARTPAEIEPTVFDVGGVAVSHLSYTFSFNGLSLPAAEPWRSAVIDPQRIVADADEARRRGAEVVVVSLHWGNEGVAEPSAWQRDVADRITRSGAIDLIVGHHAHVVQPLELVNGTWVVYGLGNILSNLPTSDRWPASSQDGVVAVVGITVTADGDVAVWPPQMHPTWVDRDAGWLVRLVQAERSDPTLDPALRARLDESLARTAQVVGDRLAAASPG